MAVALLTSACTAKVSTAISVSGSAASSIVVGATFDGELGTELTNNASLRNQLQTVISDRLHQPVSLSSSNGVVSWSSTISYTQLTANSDITGVSSAALTRVGTSSAQVTLVLVQPSALSHAIITGVGSRKDASDLAKTMAAFTQVIVTVSFPGAASVVSAASGIHPSVSGGTVTVTQQLSGYNAGTVVVQGSLVGPGFPWIWVGGGLVALILIWLAIRWIGSRPPREYRDPLL